MPRDKPSRLGMAVLVLTGLLMISSGLAIYLDVTPLREVDLLEVVGYSAILMGSIVLGAELTRASEKKFLRLLAVSVFILLLSLSGALSYPMLLGEKTCKALSYEAEDLNRSCLILHVSLSTGSVKVLSCVNESYPLTLNITVPKDFSFQLREVRDHAGTVEELYVEASAGEVTVYVSCEVALRLEADVDIGAVDVKVFNASVESLKLHTYMGMVEALISECTNVTSISASTSLGSIHLKVVSPQHLSNTTITLSNTMGNIGLVMEVENDVGVLVKARVRMGEVELSTSSDHELYEEEGFEVLKTLNYEKSKARYTGVLENYLGSIETLINP